MCYQTDEYTLTESQEHEIQQLKLESQKEAPQKDADRHNDVNANPMPVDLKDTRIVYLPKKNFEHGTFRIRQSGASTILIFLNTY